MLVANGWLARERGDWKKTFIVIESILKDLRFFFSFFFQSSMIHFSKDFWTCGQPRVVLRINKLFKIELKPCFFQKQNTQHNHNSKVSLIDMSLLWCLWKVCRSDLADHQLPWAVRVIGRLSDRRNRRECHKLNVQRSDNCTITLKSCKSSAKGRLPSKIIFGRRGRLLLPFSQTWNKFESQHVRRRKKGERVQNKAYHNRCMWTF